VVGFGCGQSGEQAKGLGFKISAATHLSPPWSIFVRTYHIGAGIRNCIEPPFRVSIRVSKCPALLYMYDDPGSQILFYFSNTKNRLFFESDVFQMLRSDDYVLFRFFKYPEPEGIKSPKIHSHHLVCVTHPINCLFL
jgi:hypothetical protein